MSTRLSLGPDLTPVSPQSLQPDLLLLKIQSSSGLANAFAYHTETGIASYAPAVRDFGWHKTARRWIHRHAVARVCHIVVHHESAAGHADSSFFTPTEMPVPTVTLSASLHLTGRILVTLQQVSYFALDSTALLVSCISLPSLPPVHNLPLRLSEKRDDRQSIE